MKTTFFAMIMMLAALVSNFAQAQPSPCNPRFQHTVTLLGAPDANNTIQTFENLANKLIDSKEPDLQLHKFRWYGSDVSAEIQNKSIQLRLELSGNAGGPTSQNFDIYKAKIQSVIQQISPQEQIIVQVRSGCG